MREKGECGGIILGLVAVVAIALVGGAVYVASIGYGSLILSELQAAADAAAHAAVIELQSDSDGWIRARSIAIETVNKQFARGNLGESNDISIDPTSTSNIWSVGSLRVSIERGRWLNASAFESFEDWEIDTPGRPGFMAFNAVQVKVERSGINSILSPVIRAVMDLHAEAVGVAGRVEDVCIPPFAVPVCALVRPNGTFDIRDAQVADMVFTEVNRYCPDHNPECGAAPSFLYTSHHQTIAAQRVDIGGVTFRTGIGIGCGWPSPLISDSVPDGYGVVGLPYRDGGMSPAVTEGNVRQAVVDFVPRGCDGRLTGGIGDRFKVLPGGLTEPESEDAVWKKIWDFPLSEDPDLSHHRAQWAPDLTYNFHNPALGTIYHTASFQSMVDGLTANLSATCRNPAYKPRLPGWGLCRSRRFRVVPDTCGYRLMQHPSWPDDMRCYTEPTAGQGQCFWGSTTPHTPQGAAPYDKPRNWQVRIPIIADISPDASLCQGTGDGSVTVEQFLDTSHPLEVIGFTEGDFADVDIGGGFPVNVDWMNGCPTEKRGMPFGFPGKTNADGTEGRCNAVRGNLNIYGFVFADTEFPDGPSEPRLVN